MSAFVERWRARFMARSLPNFVAIALICGAFDVGVVLTPATDGTFAAIRERADMPAMGTLSSLSYRGYTYSRDYSLPLVGETARPPQRFQNDARAVIEVIEPEKIEGECFAGGPGALACTKMYPGRPTMVMPNPCAFPFDSYAVMLCHEVGHVNGWEHGSGA